MDFLAKEFEGVPDEIVIATLKQIESGIRALRVTIHDPTIHHLHVERVCARIVASIDFVQTFKKGLDSTQTK